MKNYKFTYVKLVQGINEYKVLSTTLTISDNIDLFDALREYETEFTILSIIPIEF